MKSQNIEMNIAYFAMFMAIVNILIVLLKAPLIFLRPFSIGLSVLIFYFGWGLFKETESYQKMKQLFFIYHLEQEAQKKAREVISNVK